MCNCSELKEFVVNLDSNWLNQAIPYQGKQIFSEYFAEIEAEDFQPDLDYSESYYTCFDCGQAWYLECEPQENTWPLFGIKLSNIEPRLSQNDIESYKKFAVILAHNGFEDTKCRQAGCENFKLKGRELCHQHFSLL